MFWKIIFQEKFIHSSDFLCSVFNMFKCINIVSIFGSWISFHFINVKPRHQTVNSPAATFTLGNSLWSHERHSKLCYN